MDAYGCNEWVEAGMSTGPAAATAVNVSEQGPAEGGVDNDVDDWFET